MDYYNFTNESSLWFDNSTALSEEERIIQQKLNSSFGAWLVFMVLGQRIYQYWFYYSIILSKVKWLKCLSGWYGRFCFTAWNQIAKTIGRNKMKSFDHFKGPTINIDSNIIKQILPRCNSFHNMNLGEPAILPTGYETIFFNGMPSEWCYDIFAINLNILFNRHNRIWKNKQNGQNPKFLKSRELQKINFLFLQFSSTSVKSSWNSEFVFSELVVGFDEQFLIYLLTVTIPLSTPSAVTQCGK